MQWPREGNSCIDFHGLALDVASHRYRTAVVSSAIDCFEFEAVADLVEPGDRVVVAGLGMGSVAAWAAAIAGVENVTAYEPNGTLIQHVQDGVRVGGQRLDVRWGALAASGGVGLFYLRKDDPWYRGTIAPIKDDIDVYKVCHDAPMIGINDAINERGANVLLLDVEGAEYAILPVLDFTQLEKLIIEFHGTIEEVEPLKKMVTDSGMTFLPQYSRYLPPHLHIEAAVHG